MNSIGKNWQIWGATAFAIALVFASYLLARSTTNPPRAEASTETALLTAIASKDSDGDGLPDWEEALYGTDPNKVDTRGLGMTDGEAVAKGLIVPKAPSDLATVTPASEDTTLKNLGLTAPTPGSLTDTFAKNFLALYISAKQAKNGPLTEADTANIATEAVSQMMAAISQAPDYKTAGDLKVVGSGPDAMRAFAVAAEAVMLKNTSNASKGELEYLTDALQKGDTSAFAHISSIADSYRNTAIGLSVLPVPPELASADLAIINAFARLSQIQTDFTHANTDPLATMLALQEYPQTVLELGNGFIAIQKTYLDAGVTFAPNAPGASFVNIIKDVADSEKAAAKK